MLALQTRSRAIEALPNRRPRWLRPLIVGFVVGALMVVSVASVTAKRPHNEHYIGHPTSFVSTQKDPNVLAPGEELYIGGDVLRFDSPHDKVGTYAIWCAVTGLGGSEVLCTGGEILPPQAKYFLLL